MKQGKENKIYIAIDLKSFYASVECTMRNLNPLTTNLVVADGERTEKTICLAVSPSLKAYGIPGRARLFEVIAKVKEVNAIRILKAPNHKFTGKSCNDEELRNHPELAVDFIVATPRMQLYMDYSAKIYSIYLKYAKAEDIHVYSVDEVFIDAGAYLKSAGKTPREFARKIIQDILDETNITATAGIGTNLYLCKVAMDIVAKHTEADKDGVRIAQLDEMSYRRTLWTHEPLTDFWRVGRGYAKKLESLGMYTMGDIAKCSIGGKGEFYNEDLLYKLFGVNAELLIDHAWGYEPCTMAQIKAYKPREKSLGQGQVLQEPYTWEKGRLVLAEMLDSLALQLVDKGLECDQIVITIGYDIENLNNHKASKKYKGEVTIDRYGRKVPKHAHGTVNLEEFTSLSSVMREKGLKLYDEITDKALLIRRFNISANHVREERDEKKSEPKQLNLFTDFGENKESALEKEKRLEEEKKMQKALLDIKKKYGKNAILKGMSLEEGATEKERNERIGGHKA